MNSFYEIAVKMANKQSVLVDKLTKATPVIRSLPMMPTSDGLSNVYEEIVSIDSAEEVDFDGTLPTVDVESKLGETQLTKFGAKMQVGQDRLKKLNQNPAEYFAMKAEKVAKQTGMNMEYAMIYNLFRSKAIANSNYTKIGGSAGTNYSMVIVTFESGENIGLYDAEGFGKGDVMQLTPYWGGNVGEVTLSGKTFPGYAMAMSTYFGVQTANVDGMYVLANIDLANTKVPTQTQIDDALDAVRLILSQL